MKLTKFISVALLALAVSATAFAQDEDRKNSNRDENGKIVRGPYQTNGFWDNWFVGAAGGINIFMNSVNDFSGRGSRAGAANVYVGKYFTPDFGVRLGYLGWQGHMEGQGSVKNDAGETVSVGKETFGFWYVHGDVMWNISNTIGGYKDRFWNFIPYVHFGGMRIYNHEIENYEGRINEHDNEIAFGCGLYNTIRITKRLYGTLDIRETMLPSRYHTVDLGGITSDLSVLAGIGVYLGKVGWDRAEKSGDNAAAAAAAVAAAEAALLAAQEAQKAAEDKNKELEDANKALADNLRDAADKADSLAQAAKDAEKVYINDTTFVTLKLGTAPCTLFFEKNSATLNATELQHLDFYVQNIIKQDPEHEFYITGVADAATGNAYLNARISALRAKNVKNLIVTKYGIDPDKIIFKDAKISSKYSDPRLDRAVIIEH